MGKLGIHGVHAFGQETLHLGSETRGVELYIEGYGTKAMPPGTSAPIYLEIRDGLPKLYVWADINSEDPTHVIDLNGASEALRSSDPMPPEGSEMAEDKEG